MIRQATIKDIDRILELGVEFGHLMKFHQTIEGLTPHIGNIIVHETGMGFIDGYYHIQPIKTIEDIEFIEKEKCIPRFLLEGLLNSTSSIRDVAVLMQGASHREVFRESIRYYKDKYDELWSWCSIKSNRPQSYLDLGFSYNPKIEYTFWNHQVDRMSTYQLGIWTRD